MSSEMDTSSPAATGDSETGRIATVDTRVQKKTEDDECGVQDNTNPKDDDVPAITITGKIGREPSPAATGDSEAVEKPTVDTTRANTMPQDDECSVQENANPGQGDVPVFIIPDKTNQEPRARSSMLNTVKIPWEQRLAEIERNALVKDTFPSEEAREKASNFEARSSDDEEVSIIYSDIPPAAAVSQSATTRIVSTGACNTFVAPSPDPVQQVRQVEYDERYARMLQAQYFAMRNAYQKFRSMRRRLGARGYNTAAVYLRHTRTIAGFPPTPGIMPDTDPLRGRTDMPLSMHHAEERQNIISTGLQERQINALPTKILGCDESATSQDKECEICLVVYKNGDLLRILPCSHEFHRACIDSWLKIKSICPVCRLEVKFDDD